MLCALLSETIDELSLFETELGEESVRILILADDHFHALASCFSEDAS